MSQQAQPKTWQDYLKDAIAVATGEKSPTVKTEVTVSKDSVYLIAGLVAGILVLATVLYIVAKKV